MDQEVRQLLLDAREEVKVLLTNKMEVWTQYGGVMDTIWRCDGLAYLSECGRETVRPSKAAKCFALEGLNTFPVSLKYLNLLQALTV